MVLRCRLSISLRGESDAKTAYKGGYSGNSSHCFSPLARWFAYLAIIENAFGRNLSLFCRDPQDRIGLIQYRIRGTQLGWCVVVQKREMRCRHSPNLSFGSLWACWAAASLG